MTMISGLRYLFGRSSITLCGRECVALPHIRGISTMLLTKLFVGGLSGNTNEQILKETFSRYGQVVDATVTINRQTGWSKGYGFVQFASEIEADNAVNQMDGQVLDGKKINVNIARPGWQDTGVQPPRAVGPPSQILEKNEEQGEEKVRKKGLQKAVGPRSQASEKNEQNKMSKENKKNAEQEKKDKKEKKAKEGKKKKEPSSLNKQTFIEDLDG